MIEDILDFKGITYTINTTENCNLRCKYCYETCKTSRTIELKTAYRFIDLIYDNLERGEDFLGINRLKSQGPLGRYLPSFYEGCIWDFIGGDSLIDPDLLDKLFTRINTRHSLLSRELRRGWRASISSNGTLFEREDVRKFCEKWHKNLSLGVSIDGCPEIHNMNRVYPDGSGSMENILKYWDWYRKWFPLNSRTTKATCSKSTIPYLYDSLKFMHEELGMNWIHQNFIMEDTGCTEDDYQLLDKQLEKCVSYVLDHDDSLYWSMIDNNKLKEEPGTFETTSRCGSGIMPCCAIDGNIYPCFRWLPHTQNGKSGIMCVGNVEEGFAHPENFVRVQEGSIRANCTKEEKCKDCKYEPECAYCIGGCYAEYGDFVRTTHICEITKLICKWSELYEKLYREKHKLAEEERVRWRKR